jgi:ketosteroid isomerase-like protein
MRRERERACDDIVLNSGARPSQYADQLLDIASSLGRTGRPAYSEVSMARSSQLSGRLLAILDPAVHREPPRRMVRALMTTALAVVAVLLSAFETGSAPASDAVVSSPPAEFTVAEFEQAWHDLAAEMLASARARDAARFAACYSRHAHLMAQGVPTIRGRQAIADLVPRMWTTGFSDIDLQALEFFRVGELFCVVGNLSFLDDTSQPVATARFMGVYVYEDGRWRILRDIANS